MKDLLGREVQVGQQVGRAYTISGKIRMSHCVVTKVLSDSVETIDKESGYAHRYKNVVILEPV